MCIAAAIAGAGVVGGVASSAISSSASKSAASTQADASNYAAQLQQQQYDQTRSDLQPYRDVGTNYLQYAQDAIAQLGSREGFNYGDFNYTPYQAPAAFTAPTAAEAAATPGYQFTLDQGLKAAQNSASARGLGSSGAALKGASTYASGLADSTYNDTFNRALQAYQTNTNTGLNAYNTNYNSALSAYNANRSNQASNYAINYGTASDNVNRLLGLVNIGQNSAALTASAGQQAANGIANAVTSGAAAQAAGTVGAANGISSGISTAVNGGTNALLLSSLTKTPSYVPTNTASTLYGQSIGSNPYGFTTG